MLGAIGSVQTTPTRTYSASGSFVYSGTTAQVTGTGTASAFTISAFNPAGVTLSQTYYHCWIWWRRISEF
jgi:hypothetical protein